MELDAEELDAHLANLEALQAPVVAAHAAAHHHLSSTAEGVWTTIGKDSILITEAATLHKRACFFSHIPVIQHTRKSYR